MPASPPVLTENNPGHTISFTERGPAVYVDGPFGTSNALTVTDPSSTTLTSATVEVIAGIFGDALQADPAGTSITVSGQGTGTLTLSGTDTLANYQAVLDSVRYSNGSHDPTG